MLPAQQLCKNSVRAKGLYLYFSVFIYIVMVVDNEKCIVIHMKQICRKILANFSLTLLLWFRLDG